MALEKILQFVLHTVHNGNIFVTIVIDWCNHFLTLSPFCMITSCAFWEKKQKQKQKKDENKNDYLHSSSLFLWGVEVAQQNFIDENQGKQSAPELKN